MPDESADGAARLAERCRQAIEQIRLDVHGDTLAPTASFGVAEAEATGTPSALVAQADAALYEAKAAGRNTVRTAPAAPLAERP